MFSMQFDPQKAVEIILYLSRRLPTPTFYYIMKVLYFADLLHLERYGRFISGDNYVAMGKGPVPSKVYDILKYVKGVDCFYEFDEAKSAFTVENGVRIKSYRDADLFTFSDSEIKCLDESAKANGSLSFGALKDKSHDANYKSADENDFIDFETIVKNLPNGNELLEHLSNPYPG